jgi:VanZ family protein
LRRSALLIWLASIALVITGSLLPASAAPMRLIDQFNVNDKVLHFCAYLVLAFIPALTSTSPARGLAAAVSMVLLGVTLEYLQRLVPGRSFETGDMMANSAGVACGVVLGGISRFLDKKKPD